MVSCSQSWVASRTASYCNLLHGVCLRPSPRKPVAASAPRTLIDGCWRLPRDGSWRGPGDRRQETLRRGDHSCCEDGGRDLTTSPSNTMRDAPLLDNVISLSPPSRAMRKLASKLPPIKSLQHHNLSPVVTHKCATTAPLQSAAGACVLLLLMIKPGNVKYESVDIICCWCCAGAGRRAVALFHLSAMG